MVPQVPSEHTQDGKRYDAEMQLAHFYSVTGENSKAGVPNQMGTVSVFLQAYDNVEDYDMLNKIICQWRIAEDATREQCGMPSVYNEYYGCATPSRSGRNLRQAKKARSAYDVFQSASAPQTEGLFHADPTGTEPNDNVDNELASEWSELLRKAYGFTAHGTHGRNLAWDNYAEVGPWNNYFGLDDVKTEYYFRYSG